uniref:RGS domain-containing protein n=1 Tax=Timema poppense TaxID=170557 RepID=A0A7R9H5S3_TIMPO|nr:unnamed protein product [Timema poppensis]
MAGCLPNDRRGSLSPETRKHCAESLDNVLGSSIGREKFHDYLETRGFEEEIKTLIFWGKCNKLINKHKEEMNAAMTRRFHEKARRTVEFAEEEDVNLDLGELQRLHKAVKGDDHKTTVLVLKEVRQSAFHLLGDSYRRFRDHLVVPKK